MRDTQDLYDRFPRLAPDNHQITSTDSDKYNCVAWVRRELDAWWEPGFVWPDDLPVPEESDLEAYIELFRRWGYEECPGAAPESGYLKIAVYATDNGDFSHVAKQLRDGSWSSKAGILHDLRHCDLDALEGSWALQFAMPSRYLRRPDDRSDPMTLEQTGLISPQD